MRKSQILKVAFTLIITMTATGCGANLDKERTTIDETGGTITIIEDVEQEVNKPDITIDRIESFEKREISDWLDEENVIVSRENETLNKMRLEELSDYYPRSLYQYSLKTGEYRLLVEDQEQNLGGGVLSPDKKYLLYYGYTLGDPSFYILDLETLESVNIKGETIGNVGGAKWADNYTVIGPGYMNGAYVSDVFGNTYDIKELLEEAIYNIVKINDTIYFTTTYDATLMSLNISTQEKLNLGFNHVLRIIPSPDRMQMVLVQSDGAKQTISLVDIDGSNKEVIAEGTEIGGVSWSPDQRMFAYSIKGEGTSPGASSLYIYDMLTSKSVQIAVDVENITTSFSPDSKALAFSNWNGTEYNSSIVYFKINQ